MEECSEAAIDEFFHSNSTPEDEAAYAKAEEGTLQYLHQLFLEYPACPGVAFITSGGTTVPLELNAVRSLHNFSSGRRGSRLVESYLEMGWACVMLRHAKAVQPFRRLLDKVPTGDLMDWVAGLHAAGERPQSSKYFSARDLHLMGVYHRHHRLLHVVEFDTIGDYLSLLRRIAGVLTTGLPPAHRMHALPLHFYAACAASDYYLPLSMRSAEKISGGTELVLRLPAVPKMLGHVRGWLHRPHSDSSTGGGQTLFITFKLETSREAMHHKAVKNLEAYHCDAVVANMLQTHHAEVWVYAKGADPEAPIHLSADEETGVDRELVDYFINHSPMPAAVAATSPAPPEEESAVPAHHHEDPSSSPDTVTISAEPVEPLVTSETFQFTTEAGEVFFFHMLLQVFADAVWVSVGEDEHSTPGTLIQYNLLEPGQLEGTVLLGQQNHPLTLLVGGAIAHKLQHAGGGVVLQCPPMVVTALNLSSTAKRPLTTADKRAVVSQIADRALGILMKHKRRE